MLSRRWRLIGVAALVATCWACAAFAGSPSPICHGARAVRAVALTFDACQTARPAGYDAGIIAILRATHTPATLFLGGRWMETHPAVTRALGRDPLFELANHSYLHPHLRQLADGPVRAEVQKTQDIMFRLTGKRARFFRAPYGEYDERVLRAAEALGLKTVQWEVVTGDPDPRVSAPHMIKVVLERTRNGSIIIMHMNGRGRHTAAALPAMIRGLRQAGFRLVTLRQLLAPSRERLP